MSRAVFETTFTQVEAGWQVELVEEHITAAARDSPITLEQLLFEKIS
jgi:hypothetical protein